LNSKDLLLVDRDSPDTPEGSSREMDLAGAQTSHRIARFSSAPLELVSAEAHLGGSNAERPFSP
jgi:hypothetical protein